jgi:hypothetical protein
LSRLRFSATAQTSLSHHLRVLERGTGTPLLHAGCWDRSTPSPRPPESYFGAAAEYLDRPRHSRLDNGWTSSKVRATGHELSAITRCEKATDETCRFKSGAGFAMFEAAASTPHSMRVK